MLKSNEQLEDLQVAGLQIIQSKTGYRFTSDAVILANFVKAKKNCLMIDLCSGSGVVGLLASAANSAKKTYLVEIQPYFSDMSQRSIDFNGLSDKFEVINRPLQNVSEIVGKGIFDVVTCNPPYKKADCGKVNKSDEMAVAKHEIKVCLEEVILEASKLLTFGGSLYLCNKEERLAEIIMLCKKYGLEPKELLVRTSAKGGSVIFVKASRGGSSGMKVRVIS